MLKLAVTDGLMLIVKHTFGIECDILVPRFTALYRIIFLSILLSMLYSLVKDNYCTVKRWLNARKAIKNANSNKDMDKHAITVKLRIIMLP